MPDFKNGKIYTIRCKLDTSLIYVGSTTQKLCERMTNHRNNPNKNISFYSHVKDWNDWYIELYEDFPCERREQLVKREGEITRQIGTLNKNIAGRTRQEYRIEEREKIKEYDERTKEHKKEYSKEYREQNKEKIKNYRDNHKEKAKEYNKEYREQNKEKLKDHYKEPIQCECGLFSTKTHMQRHMRTQRHKDLMNSLKDSQSSV
jgi:hypothetical protein